MLTLNTQLNRSTNMRQTKQVGFGYNYSALAKDMGANAKKFVFTVPPKEDMLHAVKLGLIEGGKLLLLPAASPFSPLVKVVGDGIGAFIREQKPLSLKKNPFNVMELCNKNPIETLMNYIGKFKK